MTSFLFSHKTIGTFDQILALLCDTFKNAIYSKFPKLLIGLPSTDSNQSSTCTDENMNAPFVFVQLKTSIIWTSTLVKVGKNARARNSKGERTLPYMFEQ